MTHRVIAWTLLLMIAAASAGCGSQPGVHGDAIPLAPEGASPDSDSRAVELARSVLERMGGADAWERTRYVRWRFFGGRLHHWDRWSGDIRIEIPAVEQDGVVQSPEMLVLMSLHTGEGRAWQGGYRVRNPDELKKLLDLGLHWWVNDSYWVFMPYKLLDPGVVLRFSGERALADGRAADVIDLTFADGTGYTPMNRYEVFVARDTGLVEQWAFYAKADDPEPRFTLPWSGWKRFGEIMLPTDHGRGLDWQVAVFSDLPASTFKGP